MTVDSTHETSRMPHSSCQESTWSRTGRSCGDVAASVGGLVVAVADFVRSGLRLYDSGITRGLALRSVVAIWLSRMSRVQLYIPSPGRAP